MKGWSGFFLALVVALVFAAVGFYYLIPGVYHPFSTDTFGHTTQHLTPAALFLGLAVVTLILGRFVRPGPKA